MNKSHLVGALCAGVFSLLISTLLDCATSGDVGNSFNPEATNKVIFVSDHFTGYEQRHVGSVIRVFEKYGFSITKDRKESEYYLDFVINGGASIEVNISLLQNNRQVLSVSSENAGWGTVIARPSAISSRVTAALSELDKILSNS